MGRGWGEAVPLPREGFLPCKRPSAERGWGYLNLSPMRASTTLTT